MLLKGRGMCGLIRILLVVLFFGVMSSQVFALEHIAPRTWKMFRSETTSVTLSWSPVSGAELYQVAYYEANDQYWSYTAASSSTIATITGVSDGEGYRWQVGAYAWDSQQGQYVLIDQSNILDEFYIGFNGGAGEIVGWGNNTYNELGLGESSQKETLPQHIACAQPTSTGVYVGTGFRSLTAGDNHALAIDTNGILWGWGKTTEALGRTVSTSFPVVLLGSGSFGQDDSGNNIEIDKVFAGSEVTYVTTKPHVINGQSRMQLYSAGNSATGQLGRTGSGSVFALARDFVGATDIKISVGSAHTLALVTTNTGTFLYSTGSGTFGQLFDGEQPIIGDVHEVPTFGLRAVSSPKDIAAGEYHSLAIYSSRIYGTGQNDQGELGFAITDWPDYPDPDYNLSYNWNLNQLVPAHQGYEFDYVASTTDKIFAGYSSSAVIKSDGSWATHGYNAYGQLGLGSSSQSVTRILSSFRTSPIAQKILFGERFGLLLSNGGTAGNKVYATGNNYYGVFGNGTSTTSLTNADRTLFAEISDLNEYNPQDIAVGKNIAFSLMGVAPTQSSALLSTVTDEKKEITEDSVFQSGTELSNDGLKMIVADSPVKGSTKNLPSIVPAMKVQIPSSVK